MTGLKLCKGDNVDIKRGAYKGKVGSVVEFTPKMVYVKLVGIETRKLLSPGSLVHREWVDFDSKKNTLKFAPATDHGVSIQHWDGSSSLKSDNRQAESANGLCKLVEHMPLVLKTERLRKSRTSADPDHLVTAFQQPKSERTVYRWCTPGGDDPLQHSCLGFLREDFVEVLAPGQFAQKDKTLGGAMFGSRVHTLKITVNDALAKVPGKFIEPDGRRYHLLSTKLQRKNSEFGSFLRSQLQVQYVLVDGTGVRPIDLETELRSWAGFGRLQPEKVVARLELVQSTACVHKGKAFILDNLHVRNGKVLIFDHLTSSKFEEIPEDGNEGCGFFPVGYFGVGIFAVQVRIVASRLGIFKGMLCEKPGISSMQLPPSMKKVGPSEEASNDKAYLLINGVFPCRTNVYLAKLFSGGNPLKLLRPSRLSFMVCCVLEDLNVPKDLLSRYVEESSGNLGRGLQHSCLVGLVDPTGSIPPGSVFVTGFHNAPLQDDVLVTRFPCTEAGDAHLLSVLRERPTQMPVCKCL